MFPVLETPHKISSDKEKVLKKTQKHNKKVLQLFLETSTFLENVTKKL